MKKKTSSEFESQETEFLLGIEKKKNITGWDSAPGGPNSQLK